MRQVLIAVAHDDFETATLGWFRSGEGTSMLSPGIMNWRRISGFSYASKTALAGAFMTRETVRDISVIGVFLYYDSFQSFEADVPDGAEFLEQVLDFIDGGEVRLD